ncbi:MAG: uncharacterized protein A8A55_1726 [Amphiamblys sp. WSBS2006]|nr:MAG: uncharacterized protein A8A55_1726 [Amphiamblys sp. WSBS2006]
MLKDRLVLKALFLAVLCMSVLGMEQRSSGVSEYDEEEQAGCEEKKRVKNKKKYNEVGQDSEDEEEGRAVGEQTGVSSKTPNTESDSFQQISDVIIPRKSVLLEGCKEAVKRLYEKRPICCVFKTTSGIICFILMLICAFISIITTRSIVNC